MGQGGGMTSYCGDPGGLGRQSYMLPHVVLKLWVGSSAYPEWPGSWPKVLWSVWKEMQGPSYRLGNQWPSFSAEPQLVGPPVFCYLVCSADVENQPQRPHFTDKDAKVVK